MRVRLLFTSSYLSLSMFPPSPSSSLLQRSPRGIRQNRHNANALFYSRPSHPRSPLRNLTNAKTAYEEERSARRASQREGQLALQDTPSRRHRRTPNRHSNENRDPSPTPRRTLPRIRLILLPTPPESQNERPQPRPWPRVNLIVRTCHHSKFFGCPECCPTAPART
ncbi:hypothetical protein C8F01DRAFT_1153685 [Mycena amicta]|nr:hypothetical protein C8F01DRAFT_1153685 [Mycena amicta]